MPKNAKKCQKNAKKMPKNAKNIIIKNVSLNDVINNYDKYLLNAKYKLGRIRTN